MQEVGEEDQVLRWQWLVPTRRCCIQRGGGGDVGQPGLGDIGVDAGAAVGGGLGRLPVQIGQGAGEGGDMLPRPAGNLERATCLRCILA